MSFDIQNYDYINVVKLNSIGTAELEQTFSRVIETTNSKRVNHRISNVVERSGSVGCKAAWRAIESTIAVERKSSHSSVHETEFFDEFKQKLSETLRELKTVDYDKLYYYYQGCIDVEDKNGKTERIILSELLLPEQSINLDHLMDEQTRISYQTRMFLSSKGLNKRAHTQTIKLDVVFPEATNPVYYVDLNFIKNQLEQRLRNYTNGTPPGQNEPHLKVRLLNERIDEILKKLNERKKIM